MFKDLFFAVFARLAELERRVAMQGTAGTVASVDAAKGTVRLKIGKDEDGADVLSPPVPYAQIAGALKVHSPPSVGQQMMLMAPGGDIEQAAAMPFTWSDQNTTPNDKGDENTLTFGDVRIDLKGGEIIVTAPKFKIVAGGVTHTIDGTGITTTGGQIKHDNKNIGSAHTHGGVMSGGTNTLTPNG